MAQNSLDRYKVVPSSVATPQRFYELRRISGLTPPPADLVAVTAGLANTWFGVTIVDTQYQGKVAGDEVVGMGRIVGDGAMMLFLSDVCVHPDHQGKGLAKHIMETLVNYVDEHAPDAQINLTGDPPAHERVYPKYGFSRYVSSVAMFRWAAKRAKDLAESPVSGYYKKDGKPAVPAFATAWLDKQHPKA